jgi:endonuclease-3
MQDESGRKMQKREMAEKDENLEGKRRLALEVIERLRRAYPDADCTLDYDDAWKLLVSVRLAAQCTDARVNVVVKDLYAKYPSPEALAKASPEEIEEIVRPCGLGRSKARDISGCMRMLVTEYGGKGSGYNGGAAAAARCRTQERQPCTGGRVRKTGDRDGYALHSVIQPDRTCRQSEGSEARGDGALENHPSGGRESPLPPVCASRKRGLYGAYQSILRTLLPV